MVTDKKSSFILAVRITEASGFCHQVNTQVLLMLPRDPSYILNY